MTVALTTAIGSFLIERSVTLDDPGLGALRAFVVAGDLIGSHANEHGIAFAAPIAGADQSRLARVRARLQQRSELALPSVTATLEIGASDSFAYVVEVAPGGEQLSRMISRAGRMRPVDTLAIACALASVLHAAALPHGQISSSLVWVADGAVALSGFAFDEPAPGADTVGLAKLVFEMLSGRRFDAQEFDALQANRADRIREALPGISTSLATVVAEGTRGAYSSTEALVAALDAARDESIVLLADAAHDSLRLKDASGANVFLDVARGYDPNHSAIKTVEARLAHISEPARLAMPAPLDPPAIAPFDHSYEPGSEQAKFLESLRVAIPDLTASKKSQSMPWFVVAAGALGMFAILTVIGLVLVQTH